MTMSFALVLVLPNASSTEGFVSQFLTEPVLHSTNLSEPSFLDLGRWFLRHGLFPTFFLFMIYRHVQYGIYIVLTCCRSKIY
jgi:hypothetical protein